MAPVRIFAVAAAGLLVFAHTGAWAQTGADQPAAAQANVAFISSAPVALLIDLSSDTVLFSKQTDRIIPPASMTKIMTSYVALDLVKKGELALDRRVTVSASTAARWSGRGSSMRLRAGDQPTIEQLLDGVVTLSGNDAAVALAEAIDGSEAAFVARMNATARAIGMTNSQFGTATGWPDQRRTLVTAQDLATLSRQLLTDFPQEYQRFYGLRSFGWNGASHQNRNPLLGAFAGADGIKTGHTNEAGYCLVGSALRDDRRLLLVVAGLPSMAARESASVSLMRWGFDQWESRSLFNAGQTVGFAQVQLGEAQDVPLVATAPIRVTVPRGADPVVRTSIRYNGPLKAPLRAGDTVAEMAISVEGQPDRTVPLTVGADVKLGTAMDRLQFGFYALFGMAA